MPNSLMRPTAAFPPRPQYAELISYIIKPLLDNPTEMKIDCEQVNQNRRVWIRLSFDDTDKGRVFGRGGRNLQAVRTVIGMAAAMTGQTVHLDIHNSEEMDSILETSSRSRFVKKLEKRRYRPRSSAPDSSYPRYPSENTPSDY